MLLREGMNVREKDKKGKRKRKIWRNLLYSKLASLSGLLLMKKNEVVKRSRVFY